MALPLTFQCNMKKFLSVLVLCLCTVSTFAEEIDVPINRESGPQPQGGPRSVVLTPSASICDAALSITYPLDAVSVVQIVDKATDAVVYSDSFAATRLVVIDLEEDGLAAGNYRLRIFVFGEWWSGEFEIE